MGGPEGYVLKELKPNLIGWIKHTHHTAKENTKQHINKCIKLQMAQHKVLREFTGLSLTQSLNTI